MSKMQTVEWGRKLTRKFARRLTSQAVETSHFLADLSLDEQCEQIREIVNECAVVFAVVFEEHDNFFKCIKGHNFSGVGLTAALPFASKEAADCMERAITKQTLNPTHTTCGARLH
jgi:hypothetical protein